MKNSYPYYFTWSNQPESGPFSVVRAERDEFILEDGKRVYDFLSTSFQTNYGHSQPAICEAIKQQLDEMPIASPKASFALKERVSVQLQRALQLDGGKLFYTVSGSEAVENALKMARQMTGRRTILARQKSYHGASLGALSVTGDWRNEPHFTVDEYTVRIPEPADDPDLRRTTEIVNATGAESIAAVIVETVSGANGVAIPGQAWFDALQSLCRQHGMLLIIDEVLCGFGRTGTDFAFQSYGVRPDLVCLSKGITGGYIPFGAVWTGPSIVEYYDANLLSCGLTNYAHPLGLAALEAVLKLSSEPAFNGNKRHLEQLLRAACNRLEAIPSVREVRCCGLLTAIDLTLPAPAWDTFFQRGLHLYSKKNSLIVAPPYISTPERLQAALDVLIEIITSPDGPK
jgi:taurine--2-oxoglutarate transaminase